MTSGHAIQSSHSGPIVSTPTADSSQSDNFNLMLFLAEIEGGTSSAEATLQKHFDQEEDDGVFLEHMLAALENAVNTTATPYTDVEQIIAQYKEDYAGGTLDATEMQAVDQLETMGASLNSQDPAINALVAKVSQDEQNVTNEQNDVNNDASELSHYESLLEKYFWVPGYGDYLAGKCAAYKLAEDKAESDLQTDELQEGADKDSLTAHQSAEALEFMSNMDGQQNGAKALQTQGQEEVSTLESDNEDLLQFSAKLFSQAAV